MIPLRLFILVHFAQSAFGACPSPRAACAINNARYKHMCSCSQATPSFCDPHENCQTCSLQKKSCDAQPCCPILNGNSFCNLRTKKCEAMRFCREDGTSCPFDDLSPAEIALAIDIVRKSNIFSVYIDFPSIRTKEPKKSEWNAANRSTSNQRIADVSVFDWSSHLVYKVVVDLHKRSVFSKVEVKSSLPPILDQEYERGRDLFAKDPRVVEAIRRRGINPRNIVHDMSALGLSGPSINLPGKRLLRVGLLFQDPLTPNFDWASLEGVQGTIELNNMTIEDFEDTGVITLPPPLIISYGELSRYPKLKPLTIMQSEGSSIRVKGQQIQWYKWKLMVSMDPIHGLQLFHVRYQADCQERLVLYKMSLSEMFVSYGDKGSHWRWRGFFDAGEYLLGTLAVPLTRGQDVPENALLLSCTQYSNRMGGATTQRDCIAAYERDVGTLYKHTDWMNGRTSGARGRQMVISFLSIIGNYGYVFEYIFHMDGTLQVNVRFTGVIVPRGVPYTRNHPDCIESCRTPIDDFLIAPHHQHFFNYRIDFDVDGPQNYALTVDVTTDPVGPSNPDGGAFSPKKKIIKVETAENFAPERSRSWHIVNSNSRNRFGTPRGYAIKPLDMAYPFIKAKNPYQPQAKFISHPFWVTAYKDHEQAAASDFPRSGHHNQGLPQYIKDKQSVENTDLVGWYTFGLTHTTRPEEWPLMNIHNAGFSLVPYNFQSQNSEVPLKASCP